MKFTRGTEDLWDSLTPLGDLTPVERPSSKLSPTHCCGTQFEGSHSGLTMSEVRDATYFRSTPTLEIEPHVLTCILSSCWLMFQQCHLSLQNSKVMGASYTSHGNMVCTSPPAHRWPFPFSTEGFLRPQHPQVLHEWPFLPLIRGTSCSPLQVLSQVRGEHFLVRTILLSTSAILSLVAGWGRQECIGDG